MATKDKPKKSNRFFSLFRTKKTKDATKEASKSISVEDSFTEINDLIPTARVEFRSISQEQDKPPELPIETSTTDNITPALPKTNGATKKHSVKRENSQKVKVSAVKSGVSRSASRASKRKKKARAAPPPPAENIIETLEKVDEIVPPKPPRDPKFVEEPTPSRKNTSVEEKKEVIRRQLSQDHLSSIGDQDEMMSLKSQSSTSCSSRRIETEVLHYSPAGSLRGVISPHSQLTSTDYLPVVERHSNIILNDNQRMKSIPVTMYDGRPKQRTVAPGPPETRKMAAAPPPPPIATPPAINGFASNPRPSAPVVPTHGIKANGTSKDSAMTKMSEQDHALWLRYEELKTKFERWKALQMEDKSSPEAKKLQKELIHDNDRVVEMLRESYPDQVGLSTMRGTFITTKKKRQSLNADMFQPRLPSSTSFRAPLTITPAFSNSSIGSTETPSTSSPTVSRAATPKTASSSSISPSASEDSVDSGMGKRTSEKKGYLTTNQAPVTVPPSKVTTRPQLTKQAASMDENSNMVRMRNGGIRSVQENQKAVDRIHEEARELLRKEKELRNSVLPVTVESTTVSTKPKSKEGPVKSNGTPVEVRLVKGSVSPPTRHRPPQVAPPPPPVPKNVNGTTQQANQGSTKPDERKTANSSQYRTSNIQPSPIKSTVQPDIQKTSVYRDPKSLSNKNQSGIYRTSESTGPYRTPVISNGPPSPAAKVNPVPRLTDNEYAKSPVSNQIKNGANKIGGVEKGAQMTNGAVNGGGKMMNTSINNNKPTPIYAVSKVEPTISIKKEDVRETRIKTSGGISHIRQNSDTVLSQPKRPTSLTAYQDVRQKEATHITTGNPIYSQTIQRIIKEKDVTPSRSPPNVMEAPVASPANIRKVVQDAKITPPSTPRLPILTTPLNERRKPGPESAIRVSAINPREQPRPEQKRPASMNRPSSSPVVRPATLDINEALANGVPALRKVAPPVERHGISMGKVVDTPSTSYATPTWTPSSSTIPAPPPPPPDLMTSPSVYNSPSRPSVGPPSAPPPPPAQLMSSPMQLSMQQLSAQKDRLKPATPMEKPSGPVDDRDALMAAIRNAGGLNGLRKTTRS